MAVSLDLVSLRPDPVWRRDTLEEEEEEEEEEGKEKEL